MKHMAIFRLYPEVKKVDWNGAYDINENPVEIDEALVEAEVARLQAEEIANAQAQEAAKQAAQAKLAKLGLTTEDLKALLG